MAQLPTGTTFAVATSYAASLPFSAASNATETVLTMAATTGLAVGDIVEITSGWGRINLRVARLKAVVASTSVTLEGIDTTNLTFFPTGTGAGSIRKITGFTTIAQILSSSSSGGDPKTVTYRYLDSDVDYNINDGFNATSLTLEIDADAIGTAGYTALKSLTDVQTTTCLLMTTRNGSKVYRPCTVALNEDPSLSDGQVNRVQAAFNGTNRITRYQS